MPDDDHLIRLVEEVQKLAAAQAEMARRQDKQEERASEEFGQVRANVEALAASKVEDIMRGIMMSWPDFAKDLGALQNEVHGPHGVERRLEEVSIVVLGTQGRNGLRGRVSELEATLRAHRWGLGILTTLALGAVGLLASWAKLGPPP